MEMSGGQEIPEALHSQRRIIRRRAQPQATHNRLVALQVDVHLCQTTALPVKCEAQVVVVLRSASLVSRIARSVRVQSSQPNAPRDIQLSKVQRG
jgi:hypothetical protein